MIRFFNVLTIFVFCSVKIFSQSENEMKFDLGGYINWTAIYDSRQTISLREGHFLLYPSNEVIDVTGKDINAKSGLNLLSIQTRVNGKLTGPEAFGAKTSGFLEAEFFGTSEGDVNGLRLRHAFVNFNWGSTALLVGQTWHPMFVAEAFPQTISFNTGVPFQPFSRNPQVRLSQSFGKFKLLAALITQRDFTSNGPAGFSSSYLRNTAIPEAHLQFQLKTGNTLLGIGGDYKMLTPRIETVNKTATDETISSYAGIAFAKYTVSGFSLIVEGIYGQNLADLVMLGGYAVSSFDSTTGKEKYTNLNIFSVWTDITVGKELQGGLFAGYSENLGSDNQIVGKIYARGENIGRVIRFSPRIQYTTGKVRVAAEVEFTQALYGVPDQKGKVNSGTNVSNTRLILGTFYNF